VLTGDITDFSLTDVLAVVESFGSNETVGTDSYVFLHPDIQAVIGTSIPARPSGYLLSSCSIFCTAIGDSINGPIAVSPAVAALLER
jgi:hypothetical protein